VGSWRNLLTKKKKKKKIKRKKKRENITYKSKKVVTLLGRLLTLNLYIPPNFLVDVCSPLQSLIYIIPLSTFGWFNETDKRDRGSLFNQIPHLRPSLAFADASSILMHCKISPAILASL
jgi:hypothetical protein